MIKKIYIYILLVACIACRLNLYSQVRNSQSKHHEFVLSWKGIITEEYTEGLKRSFIYFDGASYDDVETALPYFHVKKETDGRHVVSSVKITDAVFTSLDNDELQFVSVENINNEITVNYTVGYNRKIPVCLINFIPLRKNPQSGKIEKLLKFNIDIKYAENKIQNNSNRVFAQNSVLASGNWIKIGVVADGVYKIPYSFLKKNGLQPENIIPQNIRIYGNGGGMLPYVNSQPRYDDLQENAIYVAGENDGVFDSYDYILFYGQSPNRWKWDSVSDRFSHEINLFSDTTYYFITTDLGLGKRISNYNSPTGYNGIVNTFNDYDYYEKDLTNFVKSGREWYGENFGIQQVYNFIFTFPDIDVSTPVKLKTDVAARTINASSSFSVKVNNNIVSTLSVGGVSGNYLDSYVKTTNAEVNYQAIVPTLNITLEFNKGNSSADGWLNYIELNVRRKLQMSGGMLKFRDGKSVGNGNAKYVISKVSSNLFIWDVSDNINVKKITPNIIGTNAEFVAETSTLKEFVSFYDNGLPEPYFSGAVVNQNLHSLSGINMIIICPSQFIQQANRLAEFHRNNDGLSVYVATTGEIYNEFSSGAQDITAIKDFMKMLYDKAGPNPQLMPQYLLLFGDGSYDNKNRIAGNTNMIPTYQSLNSTNPIQSFVSDDYFGLLDDNESESTTDIVDLAIGRLPVKTTEEAENAVNKIIHYYSRTTMKPWRNWLAFVGDDGDGRIHMDQSDSFAKMIDSTYRKYNLDKIYFDAYQMQTTAGGQRYPDVNTSINKRLEQGALMITYIGHGGELGWAHERVLEIPQINSYSNLDNLPLFITATCEFSRFDDPQRTSAGELVFLNPSGGGIGLLTTTRLVYSSPNYEIVKAFNDVAYEKVNGEYPRIGDLCRITKVVGPKNINSRNFTLLGDPALRLAYPKYNVITTIAPDTMKALGKVTIKGYVADDNGQKLTSFNGLVFPVVFDKKTTIETLNNKNIGKYVFDVQRNMIFKGKASVKNGDFEFSFVVPKDISYTIGKGKISYYAENGYEDASGYFDDFIIAGIDSTASADNQGPQINLFMNDEKFVFGGITDENPRLFAKIWDENGINTVGSGIGHDITAILDENTSQEIILNDYYESETDSYQKGNVIYPFKKLSEGNHKLKIKVWDVHNNSSEASTEFVVAKSAKLALEHVLNYPNPFTTKTAFYFEHNFAGQALDVSIHVYTVSGKIVKSIDSFITTDGFRAGPIYWDGLDDFGDKIGKGVYVYKLKVTAPTGETVDKFEKLVILN